MVRVFIGHDRREEVALAVLSHSIQARASRPVAVTPVMLRQLNGIFERQRHSLQSTDFSFSRFLVPYLCGYTGWAIFMDCDMLVLDDIVKVWNMRDSRYAVLCVKHSHHPNEDTKFLGQAQTRYEKKNWSSFMLMNCARCTALTPGYVNAASGLDLHRFRWLGNDQLIGEIPHRWNHLVDYDTGVPVEQVSNLHFTSGGPYFPDYQNCGYADLWRREHQMMSVPLQS